MTERTCAVVEAVVFDMDGTLVDSESVSVASWRATAAELGFPWPDSVGRTLIGRNVTSCMKLLTDHLQGNSELAERAMQLHVDLFNIMAENDLQLMAGAREALRALKGAGMRVGLATSTHRVRAEQRLARFDLLGTFDAMVFGDEVERSKPNPDIFVEGARRLGVEPARCAAIEDSFNGVRAGHAAGMHVFMVPDLVEPTSEIATLCDAVLRSLHELPAALGIATEQ